MKPKKLEAGRRIGGFLRLEQHRRRSAIDSGDETVSTNFSVETDGLRFRATRSKLSTKKSPGFSRNDSSRGEITLLRVSELRAFLG